ncbi:PIN domain-containing protein [Methylovulum psychrotolerans]|uniref:type II toxin-antitoxin system VapC family toxin n=1 Tax=Methylovulum psychrotolerans TaxID=1704499 RepID=UPI001BFF3E78|nr:PIN domain-containing protein [Methylovulum psychrotolerans]MBT9096883.1 PIN domain-containing protein [Methylovulum psychrotolerans]
MAIIFDSNVWIAIINENDAHHEKALRLFSGHSAIYIPEYVVLETTTVLQLRASKYKADLFAKLIENTTGLEVLYASDDFFLSVLRAFQQQNQKLSFVDCALFELSKNHAVHTFDEVLAQAIRNIK